MGFRTDEADDGQHSEPYSRRKLLAGMGVALGAALAGCSGGGDGSDEGATPTQPESGGQQTDNGGDGSDGQGGNGDGPPSGGGDCATMPSSYNRVDVPTTTSDGALATIEVPGSGPSISNGSATLRVEFSIGSINVQSRNIADTTVEEELSSDLQEVTDQYDLPSGARAQRESVSASDRVDVYVPADSGVIYVSVAASGPGDCLEGTLATIRDRMVDSIQLA